jgi:hypothetical protein
VYLGIAVVGLHYLLGGSWNYQEAVSICQTTYTSEGKQRGFPCCWRP